MVSFVVAEARHLHVGGTLTTHVIPRVADAGAEPGPPLPVHLRVVGIEATPGEFPPQTQTGFKLAWLSPAFVMSNILTPSSSPTAHSTTKSRGRVR